MTHPGKQHLLAVAEELSEQASVLCTSLGPLGEPQETQAEINTTILLHYVFNVIS